jgi:hypothetical protein
MEAVDRRDNFGMGDAAERYAGDPRQDEDNSRESWIRAQTMPGSPDEPHLNPTNARARFKADRSDYFEATA